MSIEQHTPGRLFYSSALPRFHGDEVVPYAYYCIVWQATADPENPALFCNTPDRDSAEAAYDDARLIAAAPELLEALERFMSNRSVVAGLASAAAQARRAIAKARGVS